MLSERCRQWCRGFCLRFAFRELPESELDSLLPDQWLVRLHFDLSCRSDFDADGKYQSRWYGQKFGQSGNLVC